MADPKCLHKHHLVVLALLFPVLTHATENPAQAVRDDGLVETVLHSLEETHDHIAESVGTFSKSTDTWFASNTETDEKNESYLRLRLKQNFFKGGEYEGDYGLSGHIDLPRTKKRWKLIFDSDSNDLDSLSGKTVLHGRDGENIGGLSRDNQTRWFTISHDFGVRSHLPLDPFYRFRFRTGKDIGEQWRANFEQRLWYYNSEGWGEKSQLAFLHPLDARNTLRITTDVQYQEERDQIEYGQSIALQQALAPGENLRYQAGVVGDSEPNHRLENSYLQASYSRNVHEDWLILTVTPQLAFPREDDWKANPGLFLRLDIYFSAP